MGGRGFGADAGGVALIGRAAEHFYAVTPLYEDMLRLMAASGFVYTPTLVYTGHGGLRSLSGFESGEQGMGSDRIAERLL